MRISDSVLSSYLKDVYWLAGGACAGKSTAAHHLSQRHGFQVFKEPFDDYRKVADLGDFPAMRYPSPGTDWEWFFNRDIDTYVRWLEEISANILEFVVVDLLRRNQSSPVVVDCTYDPLVLARIAPRGHVIGMFAIDDLIVHDLLRRQDHHMILDCIKANTSNPLQAQENVQEAAIEASHRLHARAVASGCPILYRSVDAKPGEMAAGVELHFGLNQ